MKCTENDLQVYMHGCYDTGMDGRGCIFVYNTESVKVYLINGNAGKPVRQQNAERRVHVVLV